MSERSGGSGILGRVLILGLFLAAMVAVVAMAGIFLLMPQGGGRAPDHPPLAIREAPAEVGVAPSAVPPTAASPAGPVVAQIRARGTLLVGMDTGEPPWTGTPPMYFRNADGDDDGFDMALAKRIQAAVGATSVKVVHTKYGELPQLLTNPEHKIDLLVSGYSPADEPGVAWSNAYLEYGLCLVVPTGSKVKSVNDLFGRPIGIFDDDAAAADVNRLVKGYTELVRLEDGYWDQLLEKRFDAFLYDYPYAVAEINAFYAQNPHKKGAFRIAQYNLTDSTYAVGVRAEDADLLAAVNAAIADWRSSPDYAAAVKTYLSGGLAVEAPKDAKNTYTVAAGDTLSGIAAKKLGSVDAWPKLWELNRERFPNPDLIEVGDVVVLP